MSSFKDSGINLFVALAHQCTYILINEEMFSPKFLQKCVLFYSIVRLIPHSIIWWLYKLQHDYWSCTKVAQWRSKESFTVIPTIAKKNLEYIFPLIRFTQCDTNKQSQFWVRIFYIVIKDKKWK
jgi:hypothetical protein